MLAFGTTGSGKTFAVEGEGSTQGLIGHFAHSLFQMLEDKKFRLNAGRAPTMSSQGYTYSVKMRYVEIVDEEINDLLVHASSTAQGSNKMKVQFGDSIAQAPKPSLVAKSSFNLQKML